MKVIKIIRVIRLFKAAKFFRIVDKIRVNKLKIKSLEQKKIEQEKEKLILEREQALKEEQDMLTQIRRQFVLELFKYIKNRNPNESEKEPNNNVKISKKQSPLQIVKKDEEQNNLNLTQQKSKKLMDLVKMVSETTDKKTKKIVVQSKVEKKKIEKTEEKTEEGQKLSRILLKKSKRKVTFLVLFELFCLTCLIPSTYINKKNSMESGLKFFNIYSSVSDVEFPSYYEHYIKKHQDTKTPLIYSKIGNKEFGDYKDVEKLREQEKVIYKEECPNLSDLNNNKDKCIAIFDYKYENRLNALFSIIKTIMICLIIVFGSYWFSNDLEKLVLDPTDAMVDRVKLLSMNPLQIIQDEEKNELNKVIQEEKKKNRGLISYDDNTDAKQLTNKKQVKPPLETEILEKTISKIGALLALSLGEAGAEIISENMHTNSGNVNPMISGKKICAIYAFCDVRNFTGLTEILQEKVMVFVNTIAEIVHQIAFQYGGSANKNVGDAFLLAWKFKQGFLYSSKKNNELKVYNCQQVNQFCDMALISVIKMFIEIEKSDELDEFRNDVNIVNKFGKNCIKLGFGIHLGWSIEGALGSNFKIDASYLSPNINMANSCEEFTKTYGGNLIMTDKFVENLSEEVQKKARIVDIIEEDEPIGLYTFDFDTEVLASKDRDFLFKKMKTQSEMKKVKRYQTRIQRNQNIEDALKPKPTRFFWKEFFKDDNDWHKIRKSYTEEFFKYYNEGFDEFMFGDWNMAKSLLEKVIKIKPQDKATLRILDIMKKNNYKKPANWRKNK